MRRRMLKHRHGFLWVLGLSACMAQVNGCSSGDGALVDAQGGKAPSGGASNKAGAQTSGGAATFGGNVATEGGAAGYAGAFGGASGAGAGGEATAGSGNEAGVSNDAGAGGQPGAGGTLSGSGGISANGGASSGGAATANGGVGGAASGGTTGTGGAAMSCIFHTGAGPIPEGGAGGEGGGGPSPTITIQKNGFAGTYLADGNGRALYIYGADAPGDCKNPPITNCFNDCLVAWPAFKGEPRVLPTGLDDSLFGSITRDDGFVQGTYRGWPLYYYKSDVATGDVKGQAVGKIWQLAQVVLPNIELMRSGNTRFLGDGEGHALYTSSSDTVGTASSPPVSQCTGACLDDYPLFAPSYTSPVTYLNAADFTYFARGDGRVQLAYKGAPLYRASADTRSGTMNGVMTGWTLVAP